MRAHHSVMPFSARPGFTLVELLVALILVTCGLLALAVNTGVIMREVGSATTRRAAVGLLSSRLERLSSMPCGSDSAGEAASALGVREWWSTTPGSGTRLIRDSAEFLEAGRTRHLTIETRVVC